MSFLPALSDPSDPALAFAGLYKRHKSMSTTQVIDAPTREELVVLLAPYLLGAVLNGILLGCLSVQLYIYSISSGGDRTSTKAFGEYNFIPPLYTLYGIDVVQTAVTTYCAWLQLVWSQGPYENITAYNWALAVLQLLAGVADVPSCLGICRRIWILQNTSIMRKLVVCIVMLAVIQCLSAAGLTGVVIFDSTSARAQAQDTRAQAAELVAIIIWLTASFICDALIAGSLLHIFIKTRSQTPIKRTASLLTRLIALTVQTGFITAIAAGVQLVTQVLDVTVLSNQYYVMFSFLLGKLYSNVLLATLNARTATVRVAESEASTDAATKISQGIVFRDPSRATALVSVSENECAGNEPAAMMKENGDDELTVRSAESSC
ncbi:hypothetical protein PLICRDRAFT_180008 [Plicaturopsis crispa FD-325 SS-3]|uniref:DUF6534 domain-containing protein n=1 Tax=Plicaturopsis crispa FD-325 SS-3 TaxID=944288 RepID=A0A0C9SKM2_PLICR|nr:hypothetical protein PLICRDRAFT_180008 [Plicaturopsis crispa FD-325 SS-3]